MGDVTTLLERWNNGDGDAIRELFGVVHAELRRLAGGLLRNERPGHTLQPTDLVHEAYLRLEGLEEMPFTSRRHFYGAASQAMRRILVDHARARAAAKRGRALCVTLAEDVAAAPSDPAEVLELDAALAELAALDERESQVVELRCFGGLTLRETAGVLGISLATAKTDWAHAKAWLFTRLAAGSSDA